MMSPKRLLPNFLADSHGGVAMIIGLSIIVLIAALGVAIDSGRGYTAKSRLQGAVDAAALAGAKAYLANPADDTAEAEARMFFDANYDDDYMDGSVTLFDATIDTDSENMVVQASVTIPTTFMQVLGFNQITLASDAEVSASHTNLELALVVDVTGSMNFLDGNGEVRMTSLKEAGHALVDAIYHDVTSLPGVYLSLVPYRATVNIGQRTSWLKNYNSADYGTHGWKGCVFARDQPQDQNDDEPSGSNGRFEPYITSYAHWFERVEPVYGYPYTSNLFCPDTEVISLTDQRGAIDAGIDGLQALSGGGTITSQGLVWGWRTISPRWKGLWQGATPNDMPLDYDEPDLVKAVVLMTDGVTDIGNDMTAYERAPDGKLGTTDALQAEAEINARLSTTCESMKAEGITIFSVMFAITDSTVENIFRNCASKPQNFFNSATGDELKAAFGKIGRRLASLRLAK